jgi:hypothetical protein
MKDNKITPFAAINQYEFAKNQSDAVQILL